MSNEIVPVFACARGKENFAILCRSIDPADRDLENESRPSGICDNKIASSAEDEDLERVLARVRQRFQDLILLVSRNEITRGPANFQSRVWGQGNVLEYLH